MFHISICPKCGQQVSIPSGLDRNMMVRCPLCTAEFPLGRALEFAMAGPPQMILVNQPAQSGGTPADGSAPAENAMVSAMAAPEPMASAAGDGPATPVAVEGTGGSALSSAPAISEADLLITSAPQSTEPAVVPIEVPAPAGVTPVDGAPAEVPALGLAPMPEVELSLAPIAPQPVMPLSVVPQPVQPAAQPEAGEESGGIYALAGERPQPAAPVTQRRFDAVDNPFVDIFNDSPRPAPAADSAETAEAAQDSPHSDGPVTLDLGHPTGMDAAVAGTPEARVWTPRGKKRNPVRMVVGIIVSGLLGLLIPLLFWKLLGCGTSRPAPAPPPKQAAPAKPSNKAIVPDAKDKERWKGLQPL